MKFDDKPTFPYKNLREYIKAYFYCLNKDLEYPCTECRGYGRIYDPDDPPCPIEGNKMRNRIICPKCKGNLQISRGEWLQIYRDAKTKHKESLLKWMEKDRLKKSGLNKLTSEEKKALGLI